MTEESGDEPSDRDDSQTNLSRRTGDVYPDLDAPPQISNRVSISGEYPEPDPKDIDRHDVQEFLEKKAAVEILSQLATGPKEFNEIESALTASHGTIASRLTEGARIGLWLEEFQYPQDGGKTKLYFLNPAARDLAVAAVDIEIPQTNHYLSEIADLHEEKLDEFRSTVESWE